MVEPTRVESGSWQVERETEFVTTDEARTGLPPGQPINLPTIRSSRSARRIVVAVVVSLIAIGALTVWVVLIPYEATVAGRSFDCDALVTWGNDTAGLAQREEFDQLCDHERSSRRTTALLIGAGVATAACAASTWPSKRLTGEALGPLR